MPWSMPRGGPSPSSSRPARPMTAEARSICWTVWARETSCSLTAPTTPTLCVRRSRNAAPGRASNQCPDASTLRLSVPFFIVTDTSSSASSTNSSTSAPSPRDTKNTPTTTSHSSSSLPSEYGCDLMSLCLGALISLGVAKAAQRLCDFFQDCGIVDGRRRAVVFRVCDLAHRGAENFARARLWQTLDHRRRLEGGDRSDLLAHQLHALADDLLLRPLAAGIQHQKAERELSLERIMHSDHRAFRHIRMIGKRLLDGACRKTMACDIDDVVGARHDKDIAVFVDIARVSGLVVAGEGAEIGLLKAFFRVPEGWEGTRGQGQLADDGADGIGSNFLAFGVEHPQIPTRHRPRWRAGLYRQGVNAHAVRSDRPAGFRLPPVVDDRDPQLLLRP